jgi:hypothetical protein
LDLLRFWCRKKTKMDARSRIKTIGIVMLIANFEGVGQDLKVVLWWFVKVCLRL